MRKRNWKSYNKQLVQKGQNSWAVKKTKVVKVYIAMDPQSGEILLSDNSIVLCRFSSRATSGSATLIQLNDVLADGADGHQFRQYIKDKGLHQNSLPKIGVSAMRSCER
ncbi:MAG: hypothetical protein H7A36_03970 [Chlamydiales bacterium]|nr:hypothetical protein [Chlamydiales bacterium]